MERIQKMFETQQLLFQEQDICALQGLEMNKWLRVKDFLVAILVDALFIARREVLLPGYICVDTP